MTKFLFNGEEFETREEAEEYICGLKYSSSEILKKLRPTTYRCGYNDFCNSFYDEIEEIEEEEIA